MPRLFPSHWWWFGCKVQIEQDFSSFFPLLLVLIFDVNLASAKFWKKSSSNLPIFCKNEEKKFCSTCLSKLIFWLLHPENWKSDFGYCPIIPSSLIPKHLQKFNSLPSHVLLFELLELFFLSRTPSWSIKLIYYYYTS